MRGCNKPDNERGAVLLTTLLLMTVMAALAVAIMDDIRFSIKRAVGVQTSEQMDWYMRGGEAFAITWLQNNASSGKANLNEMLLSGEPIIFPFDERGGIQIRAYDGRNCYNINRLSAPETKKLTRNELAQLLRYMEFDNQEASNFAARIQDWVDADVIPEQGGAEDLTYTSKTPAYHAANTLMVDITELRAIEGVDEEVFQRMQPLLCAMPDTDMNTINLNSLTAEQWPLLALLFGIGEENLSEAQKSAEAVIALRPIAGYASPDAVWALPAIEELNLKGAGKDMTAVNTDFINLEIQVQMDTQMRKYMAGFSMDNVNGVTLVSRRNVF